MQCIGRLCHERRNARCMGQRRKEKNISSIAMALICIAHDETNHRTVIQTNAIKIQKNIAIVSIMHHRMSAAADSTDVDHRRQRAIYAARLVRSDTQNMKSQALLSTSAAKEWRGRDAHSYVDAGYFVGVCVR
jgi:hypothetical protein